MNDWILGGIAFLLVLLYLGGVLIFDSAFRNREKLRDIFFPFSLSSSRQRMEMKILRICLTTIVPNRECHPVSMTDVFKHMQMEQMKETDFLHFFYKCIRSLESQELLTSTFDNGNYFFQLTQKGRDSILSKLITSTPPKG